MRIRILLATGAALLITSACKEKGEVHHFRVEKKNVEEPVKANEEVRVKAPYQWTLPAGWSSKPASGMRLATIIIPQEGGENLEASITEFGGDLAGNINRWRGQIGLPALPEAEITPSLEKVDAQLGPAYIALLINPESTEKAMLAAIIPRPNGKSVFIKVTGSSDHLKSISSSFRTFTQSLTK